jgi:hypothetical protein
MILADFKCDRTQVVDAALARSLSTNTASASTPSSRTATAFPHTAVSGSAGIAISTSGHPGLPPAPMLGDPFYFDTGLRPSRADWWPLPIDIIN